MTNPIDPLAGFTPRKNPPRLLIEPPLKAPPKTASFAPPELEDAIDRLDKLSKPELVALIGSVSKAVWGIGLMKDDEIAECMLLKLAINALTTSDAKDALSNIREWLDRKKGKAVQTVQQNVNMSGTVAMMSGDEVKSLINEWTGGRVIEHTIS